MRGLIAAFLGFLIFSPNFSFSQEKEIAKTLSHREASNAALRAFDENLNASFLADDVLITTGAGILISGKMDLVITSKNRLVQEYIGSEAQMKSLSIPKPIWPGKREPGKDIKRDQKNPLLGGKYSAQWTKKSGTWLIQPQLFVTLSK